MYYIYHIIGKKIGCSKNPKRRVKQQGFSEYEILEKHDDIDIASKREKELQAQYGYRIDSCLYKDSSETIQKFRSNENSSKGGKKVFELGIGAFSLSDEQRSELSKKNGNKTKKLGVGIFSLNKEERSINGKKGGNINKLSGHISNIGKKYGSIQSICPYCGKAGQNVIMHRWHFDKCKFKK